MKRIIALLLAIVLVAWSAGGALATVYGEEGYLLEGFDEDSAWEINSVATLVKARNHINDGTMTMGRYYKLTTDLDISGYADWEPIGKDNDHPFLGHFNGNGHTITLNISRSEKQWAGLFGQVNGAVEKLTVKGNVKLLALTAIEYPRAGGIAVYVNGGTVSDCSFEGDVILSTTSTHNNLMAGGIAAHLRNGTINGSKFDGKVNALVANGSDYVYAGGIAGYANVDYGVVLNLTKNSVGKNDSSTVVKAIYSFYDNSRTYAGGIIGCIDNYSHNTTVTGNYSRIKQHAGHIDTLTYGHKNYDRGKFADNEEETPEDTPMVETSALVYGEEGYLLEGYSEETAWIIDSVATLVKARNHINDGTMTMGRYYKLTADLDISGYADWEPIGKDNDHPFKGHFNGNGHTITLNISRSEKPWAGLFGQVNGAVENLKVKGNVKLLALTAVEYPRAGGIAVYVEGGTISNSSFEGDVTMSTTSTHNNLMAGGIVAHLRNGTINGSKFDGKINALVANGSDYVYAGGIAGFANVDYGVALNLTKNSVGRKDNTTVVKAIYSVYDNSRTYAGGIIGCIDNYSYSTTVTGNYSRLKTQAGHIDTLTYGHKNYDRGKFADNEEYDPDEYPDPVPDPVEAPKITTSTLAAATLNSAYSAQLSATGGSPMTWTVTSGTLPAGLALSTTGILSGTPTTDGTYEFTVEVSNTGGKDTKSLSITVSKSAPVVVVPVITTETLPAATRGTAYSAALTAASDAPVTWSATGLPAGLAIDGSTGAISGTPTASGTFTVAVTATNSGGSVNKTFTLTVAEPVPVGTRPTITTTEIPPATKDVPYSVILEATGTAPITWSVLAPGLPAGLEINESTGEISGTVKGVYASSGPISFAVTATNSAGSHTRTFTLTFIEPPTAPTITTRSNLGTFMVGDNVSVLLSVIGTRPITWTAENLPDGITISDSGLISGTASKAGTFSIEITATNSLGSASGTFTMTVKETAVAPSITTTANLGSFKVNENVSIQLEATGTTPITWLHTDGEIPAGLALDENGLLSGTLTKAGTYTFLVSATNTAGSVSRNFTLVAIAPSPSTYPPVITTSEDLGKFDTGKRISIALKATGTTPITWKAEGLPEGLNISTAGLIYGTVTTADSYMFTVTASNTAGEDARNFTLTVEAAVVAPVITTAQDLGTYEHGGDISKKIEATGTSPLTWTAAGLPSWLTFDAETATLSGKAPDKTGETSFTITVANSAGKDSRKFSLKVKSTAAEVTAPTIKTASLPDGTSGAIYNATLDADGTSPITWTASGLPDGLTLNTSGKLAGVPKVGGIFTVNITAGNSAGNDSKEYTLTIADNNKVSPPKITTEAITDATEGKKYSFQFVAEGKNITWTATWKTLTGFTFTSDGELKGTPTAAGTYNITVKAKNTAGTDYASFTLKVNNKPDTTVKKPAIQSSKIPDAYQGEDYSYFLEATGTSPMTWKLVDGESLPGGLELAENGEITGKVDTSKAMTFKFKVTATNEGGTSDAKQISLKVVAKTPTFKSDALKEAKWNKKYSFTLKVKDMKPTVWGIEGDLPEGVKFDKGKFSGKPMEAGEFELTISVSNGAVEISDEFTLTVKGVTPKIKGSFKKGTEGEPYKSVLKATGVTPLTWDFEDLPDGLDYTTNATGEECTITGTPEEPFTGKITVTVTNGSGDDETSVSKGIKMTIKAVKPKIKTTVTEIPDGVVGERYSFQLKYSPETAEVVWSYSGSMPDGLTLNEDTGVISGVPEEAGENFKIKVTVANVNKASYKNSQTLYITIKAAGPASDKPEEPEEPEGPEFVNGVAYHERSEITAEVLARVANADEVIAAVLPAIEVEEAGMYDFTVSLDVNAPVDGLLVWHSFPNGEDDENDADNAVFLDETNEVIERVPETYSVTVSAWLEPGIIYEPIIAVKVSE